MSQRYHRAGSLPARWTHPPDSVHVRAKLRVSVVAFPDVNVMFGPAG